MPNISWPGIKGRISRIRIRTKPFLIYKAVPKYFVYNPRHKLHSSSKSHWILEKFTSGPEDFERENQPGGEE